MIHEGDLAPAFSLASTDGAVRSLAMYRGQTLVLVFLRHLG